MSLTATVQAGITAAFTALGDLVQTMYVRRSTLGTYSTTTHTVTESTADTAFTGAVTEDKESIDPDGRVIGREITVILKPGAIEPTSKDHLVIDDVAFRILAVEATKPGDTVLLWTLKLAG